MLDASATLEFAPNLRSRVKESFEIKRLYREKAAETWGGLGDYSNIPFFRDLRKTGEELISGEQSKSVEKEIHELITRILGMRVERGDDKPVIVADFGGMFGFSFLRMAASMKDLIEQGRVAFVVTNLAFTLDYGLSAEGIRTFRLTPDQIKFIQENRSLIHHVMADATEFKRRSININGKEYPLNGNIDLLHETTTITHTLKPDIDLPRLGKILSPYGIFLLGSRSPKSIPDSGHYQALRLGEENLVKMGLKEKDFGLRVPYYGVYVKPDAPPIV